MAAVSATKMKPWLLVPFKASLRSITADDRKGFGGLNEKTNRLLRQDFSKSTNVKQVIDREVKRVVNRLNERPRKLLIFKPPAYLMQAPMAALAALYVMHLGLLSVFRELRYGNKRKSP